MESIKPHESKHYPLTEAVLQYHAKQTTLKSVSDLVSEYIYMHGNKQSIVDDNYANFAVDLIAKTPLLIERFQYSGVPFEMYLDKFIKYSWHNAQLEVKKNALFKTLAMIDSPSEQLYGQIARPEINTEIDIMSTLTEISKPHQLHHESLPSHKKRWVLIVTLKTACYLNSIQIEWIANITGYTYQHLYELCERLRIIYSHASVMQRRYIEQSHQFYQRLLSHYDNLSDSNISTMKQADINTKIARIKKSIEYYKHKAASVRVSPSNLMIASLLGLPKGSVDSSLCHLRKKLKIRYEQWYKHNTDSTI